MTKLELKKHQVWQDLTTILGNINSDGLVREVLQACDYKISGYWDEQDVFYEEIALPHTLETELLSSSICLTGNKRFLQLKFSLKTSVDGARKNNSQGQKIGELVLIYDESLNFLDENWFLDIDSPALQIGNPIL